MKHQAFYALAAAVLFPFAALADGGPVFTDASAFPVFGKCIEETSARYERLPSSLKGVTRDPVWDLGRNSSGLYIRFRTNSTAIHVRWKSTDPLHHMPHMTDAGDNGLDLYLLTGEGWRFAGSAFQWARPGEDGVREKRLIANMEPEMRECMLYLSLYVIPPANVKRIEYTNQWVKNKRVDFGDNIQLQIKPGVMAYMSRYDNTTRSGFRFSLEEFDGNTLKSRLTAETIRYDSVGLWTVRDYTIRRFDGLKETMKSGSVMDTLLNIDPRDFLISKNDEQTMTSPELKEYITKQKARGVANIKNFEIEYERRIAMTAAAFILTIIGLSLSSRKVRGGIGLNIGLGLLLSFSYILFMTVTSTFAVSGYTSPRVAMWIPNFVYIIIAAILYYRASR